MATNPGLHLSEFSAEEEKKAQEAQRALQDRPKISIWLRITLSFSVFFLIICGLAIAFLYFISQFNSKQRFLEKISNYAFEMQQARRFEKNYFLYGTNLDDALINVNSAHYLLQIDKNDLISIVGEDGFKNMEESLNKYEQAMLRLSGIARTKAKQDSTDIIQLESQLRKFGAEILANASSAIDKERIEIHKLISTARIVIIVTLIFFLISIAYIINLLTRQILHPISRAVEYTQRIAKGDFTLVSPKRKYRDEFSNLAMAINRMIHEIRLRQEQLTQSRKLAAVGNLTAGIAHELNNPLNNISLTTEALLDEFDEYSVEEKKKMLNDIFNQIERASSTVKNLLDFTRTEKPIFTPVKLTEVIDTTLKLLQNEMTLNDIQLQVETGKNLPPVRGNYRNLQQVFLNLILNAIQAMPDGGDLTITSYVDDHYIRTDISDTGTGIPEENLDKIFDPFFTTKEVGKGTGLGLSVTFGIIENHKGKITVKSQVGEGTTFSVFLPYCTTES